MYKFFLFRNVILVLLFLTSTGSPNKRILLEDNFYTLMNKLNELEKEVAALKANASTNNTLQTLIQDVEWVKRQEVAAIKSNNVTIKTVQDLRNDVTSLKIQQAKQTNTVAFMAYLTTDERGTNHHIYFDDVKTNIGNAYNPRHGIFLAPVDGLYQFSVTACSEGRHYIVLEINVKDTVLGKVIAGNGFVTGCNSKVFIAQLSQGDDVFVTHTTTGEWLQAGAAWSLPSFTGFLIKET